MTTVRTIRGDYLFKVSEYEGGVFWIALEPRESTEELKKILIGFDLPKGTTFNQSKEIAKYLNEKLADLSVTFFDGAKII